ncbi:MAG: type II secretory pathway, component PulD [Saprospiraceae bacterium]|nr:type II secretory pathway, component PulD [Saprospiraceae bacterium]
MYLYKISITLFLTCLSLSTLFAQIGDTRFDRLESDLELFSRNHNNLRQKIDISAAGSVQEIVLAIAQQTKVNITIDPKIQEPLSSNFSKVKVQDVLLYLCRQYNLDLAFSGSIITIFRYEPPIKEPIQAVGAVKYNKFNNKLTLDLDQDTLGSVARRIAQQSGQNILVSKQAKELLVDGYVGDAEIKDALNLLAKANDLKIITTAEGAFYIAKLEEVVPEEELNKKKGRPKLGAGVDYEAITGLSIEIIEDSITKDYLVSVEAQNVPLIQILKGVSIEMGKDYFLFEEVRQKGGNTNTNNRTNRFGNNNTQNSNSGISLKVERVSYDEFMTYLLQGTTLTYKIEEEIYLIGDREREGLRQTKVIQLQYRSANEIEKVIPPEISEKVKIIPFLELNSVILSGSAPNIAETELFIKDIDKLVPVVQIELIIMDVQRNRLIETGIEMGVGEAPVESQGSISPGLNFTFGASTVNNLLGTLAGQGIVNLGRVVPNFYVSLTAVEDAGIIKTRSKPQLATLNSHAASFNIGETRYYQQTRTTVQGVQGAVTQQDVQFQAVQANFTVNVTPFISGDEQITLEVVVEQSDFLGEIQVGAPPAQITRKFDSKIRVKNGDMVALGGLESDRRERSGRGLPFMNRIPILNLFGRRKNNKSNSELLIFIRPLIIY